MRVDYHMHLERGPLTLEYLEQFWLQAKAQSIDEIGISDHGHNYRQYRHIMNHIIQDENTHPRIKQWLQRQFSRNLDDYVSLVEAGKWQQWSVKLGLEMDYIPGKEDLIAELAAAYPWDYLLGSVHFLGTWGLDLSPEVGWPEKDVNAAYGAYFTALVSAAKSGLFDSITHPDLVKIFGHQPTIPLAPYYTSIAAALAQTNTCVEINTAGLHKPVAAIYPHPDFLRACQEKGVPITLACDAHCPEDVGRDLDAAISLALSVGYTHVATFTQRQRTLVPLNSF